jgi:hypothetical protein
MGACSLTRLVSDVIIGFIGACRPELPALLAPSGFVIVDDRSTEGPDLLAYRRARVIEGEGIA